MWVIAVLSAKPPARLVLAWRFCAAGLKKDDACAPAGPARVGDSSAGPLPAYHQAKLLPVSSLVEVPSYCWGNLGKMQ